MAIQVMARIRPDLGLNSQEALDLGADPAKGAGIEVFTGQIVAYDDSKYNPAVAVPGNPADEAWLTVLAQAPIQVDLAALAGKTPAEVQAAIQAALLAWAASVKPLVAAKLKIRRMARAIGLVPVP